MKILRALHGRFGVEVGDVSVQSVSSGDANAIVEMLRRHGILLFRRQVLTEDELFEFSRRLGDLGEAAHKITRSRANPKVSNLTNLRDEHGAPLGFAASDTDYWHSDQQFRRRPATLATLYCLIAAPVGGATTFATTGFESQSLDQSDLEQLRALRGKYAPAPSFDNAEQRQVSHPAVLTIPGTSRHFLYVSQNTQGFVGLSDGAGSDLKERLLSSILHERNLYAHRWMMGDLLVYDNTQMLHRREEFEGVRWLKATKIFADPARLPVPTGEYTTATAGVPVSKAAG